MDILSTGLIILLLYLVYILAVDLCIPATHKAYYAQTGLDPVAIIAILSYHGIAVSWFFAPYGQSPGRLIAGSALYLSGSVLVIWARRSNPYFAPVVLKPVQVITSGPYCWLRHPAYIGFMLMSGAMLAMVGTGYGLVCCMLYWGILLFRIHHENQLLKQ